MEPDFDKLTSNKIRQAELRVTTWNKESVWKNVMHETQGAPQKHYFHYAAAAVLLLILFGIIKIQDEPAPQITNLNKKSQQQSNLSGKQSVVPAPTENKEQEKINVSTETNETARIMKIRQPISNDVSSVEPQEQVLNVPEPIVVDIHIREEEFLLPEEETIHEEKVRPIVGVITELYSGDVAKVKRKKSLHKLESLEPVPWESAPKALVFARKK